MLRRLRLVTPLLALCTLALPACDDEAEAEAPASSDEPKTRAGKMYKQGADGAKKAEADLNAKHDDILEKTANPE